MYNFHPPLAAFPVALITVALGLELYGLRKRTENLRKTIRLLLILALAGTLFTFLTGYRAQDLASQTFTVNTDLIIYHHLVGRLLLFVLTACVIVEFVSAGATRARRIFRGGYYFLLLSSFGLTLYTGYLGAELVFRYGAGVSATVASPVATETP